MPMLEAITRLPAKTIATLLKELSELQDRVRSGDRLELPNVTILLNSGHQLTGVVMRLLDADSPTLLLRSSDRDWDVHYIAVTTICGMTVHYSAQTLPLLSSGKIKTGSERVPSRLELERKARSMSEQLSGLPLTIAWEEMPSSDWAFQSLEMLLADLQAVLNNITADHLGQTALQEQVIRMEVRVATAGVRLHDRVLMIQVGVLEQDLVYLSKLELQSAIEQLL